MREAAGRRPHTSRVGPHPRVCINNVDREPHPDVGDGGPEKRLRATASNVNGSTEPIAPINDSDTPTA